MVNVAVVVATGVNKEGRRENLGFEVITTETGRTGRRFLRSLVARALSGVPWGRLRRPQGTKDANRRVYVDDSFGNPIELLEPRPGLNHRPE